MDDFRFSPENIEKAMIDTQDYNSPTFQESVNLINEWSEQPSSIITALQLMQTTQSFNIGFMLSTTIKNKLPAFWGQMEKSARIQFRDSLASTIFICPNVDNNISFFLIQSLCDIAIFDWPSEYPNFTQIIIPQPDSPNIHISLRILSTLMTNIETSAFISDLHRNSLRQYVSTDLHDPIANLIAAFISTPQLTDDILTICNYMLRWGSTNDILNFELFQKLSCELLANENTCKKAVQCLNSIFMLRTDSAVAFRTFSPLLADALSKGVFPNQLPISTNFDILLFIVHFLFEYSSVFELALTYNVIKDHDELKFFIDENVSLLLDTMNEKGISLDMLKSDLISLYQVVLSIPSELISSDAELQTSYWQLWDNNLRRVCYEIHHKSDFMPSSSFFRPFMDDIRSCLYNNISTSVDSDGICMFQTRTTIGSLYMINPDSFINFLKVKEPSPQLCYAIGTIEFVVDNNKVDSILLLVVELLQYSNSDSSPEFLSALLFGLSHSTKCFQNNNQLFSQFIEFAIQSMTCPDVVVSNAATLALYYVVQRKAGLFKGDCRNYAELLTSQSEAYITNLEHQAAVRIFKVCTYLICYNRRSQAMPQVARIVYDQGVEIIEITSKPPEEQNSGANGYDESSIHSLYARLFEPIVRILSVPEEFSQETVETALDIIRECCIASASSIPFIYEIVWPSLFQLASNVIPNPVFQNSQISFVLLAVSSLQTNMSFENVSAQINQIYGLMESRQKIEDCFFEYFTTLRETFPEMDSMFPLLNEHLVQPALASGDLVPSAMFLMIGQFSPDVVDIEWLTMTAINALNDFRPEVGDDALNALQSMMLKLPLEGCIKFLNTNGPVIVSAVIKAITDLMHKQMFVKLVDFLKFIVNLTDSGGRAEEGALANLQNLVKESIVNALSETANEPQPGFFTNFADYLFSVRRQFFKFKAAFGNLLVVLRKASPGDAELFKIEPVQQNSLFSMMFDAFFKNLVPMFELDSVDQGRLSANHFKAARPKPRLFTKKISAAPNMAKNDQSQAGPLPPPSQ